MSRQVIEASQATHRVMKESMQDADKVQDTLEDLNEQVCHFSGHSFSSALTTNRPDDAI